MGQDPASELRISRAAREVMVRHCLEAYPLEGCGLLAAPAGGGSVVRCYPTTNAARSARVYTVDPREHLAADRNADADGLEIVGVFHSHTHTPAFPSPTDVDQAPVPEWHYVLVSFEHVEAEVRSFRIQDGKITEEPVVVLD